MIKISKRCEARSTSGARKTSARTAGFLRVCEATLKEALSPPIFERLPAKG